MNRSIGAVLGFVALVVPPTVLAQSTARTPEWWMDRLEHQVSNRLRTVNNHYVEVLKPQGVEGLHDLTSGMYAAGMNEDGVCVANCRVYEVVEVADGQGGTKRVPHQLSHLEVAAVTGLASSTTMEAMGTGFAITQDFMADNVDRSGPAAGALELVFGDIDLSTEQVIEDVDEKSWEENERESPWLNPFRLFGASAGMMFDTADALGEAEISAERSAAQTVEEIEQRRALVRRMRVAGTVEFQGRPAVHLALDSAASAAQRGADGGAGAAPGAAGSPRALVFDGLTVVAPTSSPATASNPGAPQLSFAVDGQQFTFTEAGIWIDTEDLVILKQRIDGTVTAEGQTRDFFVEFVNSDFRNPPGCGAMVAPYRRVMRMGGMLDEAQTAELQEAAQQLEEFERQLASMPADQREMAESMMGGRMDTLRSLANRGAFEYVEVIDRILCDPDLEALFSIGGATGAGIMEGFDLVQIQRHLVTLGYEPGNTDGDLDTLTQVAISQFQAEHALPVTGRPSAFVQRQLEAAVRRRG